MSATPESIDARIRDFLADGPDIGTEAGFDRAMALTRAAHQRPAWSLTAWWLPEGADARRTRLVIALALVLLGALAVAVALVGGRREAVVPSPEAVATAPSTVVLATEFINERPEPIEFEFRGAVVYPWDGGPGGALTPCLMWVSRVELGSPWTLTVDGQVVLSSDQPSPAFSGLAVGGNVTLHVRGTRDGQLEVSELEAGLNVVPRTYGPAPTCAGYVQPAPDVTIAEGLDAEWRVNAPAAGSLAGGVYQVELIEGWAARPISDRAISGGDFEAPLGEFDWVQGTIQALDDDEVTLGASSVCEAAARYQWAISQADSTLTLTPIDDSCAERRALLASGPLERHPPMTLDAGQISVDGGRPLRAGRYVRRDFDPPFAFTVPPKLADASSDESWSYVIGDERLKFWGASGDDRIWFLRTPGLGWEIREQSNATPATCNGLERWLTGEPHRPDESEELQPRAIVDLDAFIAAFETWDRDHPDVSIDTPRRLTISGRPAVAIDVVAQTFCGNEVGLTAGNILERDIAVQLPDRVLVISTGPGVFLSSEDMASNPEYLERLSYDEALIDLGERLAQSVEILETP